LKPADGAPARTTTIGDEIFSAVHKIEIQTESGKEWAGSGKRQPRVPLYHSSRAIRANALPESLTRSVNKNGEEESHAEAETWKQQS
jgi:hypothetical protein